MSKVKFKRKNTEEIKNLGVEDGSLIFNYEDGTTYMDYEDRRIKMCGGDEITELLAVTDTAPTEFNSGDKYYNTTDECIYTATDDTNWGTTGEDPATNKLYVDLSESKLYYYDGIDFKSYGGGSGGGETLPVGTILPYTGGTLPSGYMLCDGSEISRKTYSKLFEIIGTSYGDGDGSTTFNLPNLKGKVPVGQDITDTDFDNLGKTGGEKEHKLTIDEMPSHTHRVEGWAGAEQWEVGKIWLRGAGNGSNNTLYNTATDSEGKSASHNNLQPYQVVNYIIKASQTTPTQAQLVDGYSTSTEDGYCCNYVNEAIKQVIGTWNLVGSATGTDTITLPSSFNELYICLKSESSIYGSETIPKEILTSSLQYFRSSGGLTTNSTTGSGSEFKVSLTQYQLSWVYINLSNISNDITSYVYYR